MAWGPALWMVFMLHLQPIGIQCKYNITTDWLTNWILNRDNDRYCGEYSFDKKQGEVHGYPTRALAVRSIMQAVKIQACTKGTSATWNNAEAMTIEKLMSWSEMQCSNELLTTVPIETMEESKHCLENGLMWAFMASAFTLWTRSVCFSIYTIYLNRPLSGVSSFSACKLWILKMDVLGQLRIIYCTSKSILKTARAGKKKRDMMAWEWVHLTAFTLTEQHADAIKAIYMISMNKISLKLIWALTFHVGRLYLKPR